jgi:hypothetical protein
MPIEALMYIGIGLLFAGLIGLTIVPLVHVRAPNSFGNRRISKQMTMKTNRRPGRRSGAEAS